MTGGAGGTVVAAVAHARRVPAVDRERFAATLAERSEGRGLLLRTCHRVEWYGTADGGTPPFDPGIPPGGEWLVGEPAIRHAMTVAVGLDSVVIGEDQLLHQLRREVGAARDGGRLDPQLDRLLTLVLRAGRRARSWRQEPPRSLADLAIEVVEQLGGPLAGRPVLVVGAGEMARLALRAAVAGGAEVSITSRTPSRARAVAERAGVPVLPFDPGPVLASQAAVFVALRGPWTITKTTADALVKGGAFVVDVSVPTAVPSGAVARLGTRFISGDELASLGARRSSASVDRSREADLIDTTVAEFLAWRAGHERRAVAHALAERVEADRRRALDELWRRVSPLAPEDREAIERMSRHLAERVLREPLERLRSDPDGRHERALRELFSL